LEGFEKVPSIDKSADMVKVHASQSTDLRSLESCTANKEYSYRYGIKRKIIHAKHSTYRL
jgi:hypothetical protein